ncbi:hypothetical protein [Aliiruegeria lutimaris]|uniref:DUF4142 domain-containing protein n=1 Tax=Aliiruegeria lutimaris TaxID=571298 RepID=A0A1G8V7W1_9RHOB|nr:hypothetical protein [Aliiruegeria lutimaris]SDJ61250.1 hypothetical protein SAMN04488026_102083 [Aliiruegeria lutimaris]
MKRTVLFTALALTLAGPALASDQLARSLGVETGVYSTGELIALRSAVENGEHAKANDILSGSITKGRIDSAPQFAASVGADSSYSTADVIALRSALEKNEQQTAGFIRNNAGVDDGFVASSKSGISAGHAQLAASLGVNAADYSLSELTSLKADQSSNNGRGD